MDATSYKGRMMCHNTLAKCWGTSKRLEVKLAGVMRKYLLEEMALELSLRGQVGFKQAKDGLGAKVAETFRSQVNNTSS